MRFSKRFLGFFCLIITCTVWGTTWVVSKNLVNTVPPLGMAAVRQFLAGIIFILFFIIFHREKIPSFRQILWLIMMAFLCFVFANGLSTLGVKFIPSGLASLIGALYPLSVFLLQSLFFNKRKFNFLTLFGSLLAISGILLVFSEGAFYTSGYQYWIGIGISLFAMISWSLATIFIARNKANMNLYYATGWQLVISSLILFVVSKFLEPDFSILSINTIEWVQILYLILFGSIIAYAAFIYSNRVLSPSIASLYAYINPFVAMIVAYFTINEPLTIQLLWGASITIVGVYFVNKGLKR